MNKMRFKLRNLFCAMLMPLLLAACVAPQARDNSSSSSNRVGIDSSIAKGLTLEQILQNADEAYREARLTDSEALYRAALRDHPDLGDVWFRLGNIYTRTGELDAAIRAYERNIQLDSQNGKAWYNLALVRLKQSTLVLEQAIQILPPDSAFLPNIGRLHQQILGRVEAKE